MLRILTIPFVFASLFVAACAAPPYVLKSGEFNREDPNYGKSVTDIDSVIVCYSSRSATPAQVNKLAQDECAKFGKTTLFTEQNYRNCPLVAPVAAVYSCVGSKIGANKGLLGGDPETNPGSTTINYDGIPFTY